MSIVYVVENRFTTFIQFLIQLCNKSKEIIFPEYPRFPLMKNKLQRIDTGKKVKFALLLPGQQRVLCRAWTQSLRG